MAREGLRVRSTNGEAGSVQIDESSIQIQLKNIREIFLKDYELKDIYNMDETGLFTEMFLAKLLVENPFQELKLIKPG